ncbi:MAG: radical SAM protein [bacterium]
MSDVNTKRIDLKLGYTCNNNCLHCVIADRRGKYQDLTTSEVFEWLDESAEKGFNDVVLTGGEVTIRKDILDVITHAYDLGFMVNIQSNGRMFCYKKFCEEVVAAARGRVGFTLALLSNEEQIHNALTRSNSHAQIVKGIRNLIEMGLGVGLNTVVTKLNYRTFPTLAQLAVAMGIKNYNYAFVHCTGNAGLNIDIVLPRKSDVSPYIKQGLQIGIDAGLNPTAEAYPACFLRGGYEHCTSEKFTPFVKLIDQPLVIEDFNTVRKTTEKTKGPMCARCLFNPLCEGPWYQYVDYYGWDEFIPIEEHTEERPVSVARFERGNTAHE